MKVNSIWATVIRIINTKHRTEVVVGGEDVLRIPELNMLKCGIE